MQYLMKALKLKTEAHQPLDRFMSRLDRIAAERSKPVVTRKTAA
jgi:hypothetical protein